jgi:hypothetical protein
MPQHCRASFSEIAKFDCKVGKCEKYSPVYSFVYAGKIDGWKLIVSGNTEI